MQIQRKELLAELQWVNRFIKKSTIPILGNVLFVVDGKKLTLTATDPEVAGITSLTGSAGRQKWSVAAPVGKLIKYLQKVDEDEITIGAGDDHWLTVTHGKDQSRTAGMSRESYPELPTPPEESIHLGGFATAIHRTIFAVSPEETRFTLNGILLEVHGEEARLIATDRYRIALSPVQVKGAPKTRALLPKFALLEASRLEEDCQLSQDDNHAFLSWGQRRIITRKLSGNFPDWQRVMPDEADNHCMVPTEATLKVLNRVALYADERSRGVKVGISDDKMTIFASTAESGQARGEVSVVPCDGATIEIGLNADYVMEFLNIMKDAPNVAFCWKDQESMVQILTEDGNRYGVMPLRI